jgi:hypothetical protein
MGDMSACRTINVSFLMLRIKDEYFFLKVIIICDKSLIYKNCPKITIPLFFSVV